MDQALLYRLYISHQMLREGIEESKSPMPINRMRSLVTLDTSIELALKTLLPKAKVPIKDREYLPSLVDKLVDERKTLASYANPVKRIHKQRNLVQHDGSVPSEEEIRIAAVEAESFLRALMEDILGISLEEITLVELVEDTEVSKYLRDAQEALNADDYTEACKKAGLAFSLAKRKLGRKSDVDILLSIIGKSLKRAAEKKDRTLIDFAREFDWELNRSSVLGLELFEPLSEYGISQNELRNFHLLTPVVYFAINGTPHFAYRKDYEPTKVAAIFAIDFATKAALKLQDWLRKHHSLLLEIKVNTEE